MVLDDNNGYRYTNTAELRFSIPVATGSVKGIQIEAKI